MHKHLTVNKNDLNEANDVWDYLYILLDKYLELQQKEPNKVIENLNNEQHSLLAYATLDAQVCNGGFIQLIYNGYGPLIFESPFIDTLKEWGVTHTAKLLKEVRKIYEEVNISQEEGEDLNDFSDLYEEYPQFDDLDIAYYNIKEKDVLLIKKYVEDHLNEFILVE